MVVVYVAWAWIGFSAGVLVGVWWATRRQMEVVFKAIDAQPPVEDPEEFYYWLDRAHPN